MTRPGLEDRVRELFKFFDQEIKPLYNKVIVCTGKKPSPFLIEVEACFFHLLTAFMSEDKKAIDKNINRAQGHLERLGLDAVKLLWDFYKKNMERLLENGEMEASVFLQFIKLTQEAREKETEKLGAAIDDKKEIFASYKKAIEYAEENFFKSL